MMEQKLIIAALIMYFALFIASIIKFSAKKQLSIFSAILSFFVPVFLIWFLINFNAYVWRKDAKKLPMLRVIPTLFWLLTAELSMIPAMHTVVVWIIAERIKKRQHSRAEDVSIFKKSDIDDSPVGRLHGELRQVVLAHF